MKERIVIEIPKDMCDNCDSCDKPTSAQIECYLEEPRQVYEIVKVPETWEELKELCEDLESKDVFITSAGDCIEYHGLQFWVSGTVCHETEKFYSIKSDRTPQQMWQIIKNLTGE